MSRKRSQLPDIYKQKKRICLGPSKTAVADDEFSKEHSLKPNEVISDAKAVLLFLRGLFPKEKFDCLLPPIILKHQVYSFIKDKTRADKQLNDLCMSGEIKLFKLPMGAGDNEYCVVFMENYLSHVKDLSHFSKKVIDKFLKKVALNHKDVSISKETLCNDLHFKDSEITELLRVGLLTFQDVGSWWLSIPNAGSFMKCFIRGRKSILMMIRKSKYREILQKELEQRKWPKLAKLGLPYHIHDVIGAELVTCIQTTSGQVLRLKEG